MAHGRRAFVALVALQVSLHACMTGLRMAAPLQALRDGQPAWHVGLLLALFAASPVVLALPAGRLADRHGTRAALLAAAGLSTLGALAVALAGASTWALMVAALGTGGGANVALIAVQRGAGRLARDATERRRVFSWLALAPAISNAAGPLLAGALIDAGGFRLAFAALAALPLAGLLGAWWLPAGGAAGGDARAGSDGPAWNLLRSPALRRLLFVNWALSASWDVHSFVIPVLGHARGMDASAIGLVLGAMALSAAGVRLALPLVAHRVRERTVLGIAMVAGAAVLAVYPFAVPVPAMVACASVLGLALGVGGPMVLTSLHHITPEHRHGEAIALRSAAMNGSSLLMPLAFGAAGAALGAASLMWVMAAALLAASAATHRLAQPDDRVDET